MGAAVGLGGSLLGIGASSAGLSAYGAVQQKRSVDAANRANELRYGEALRKLREQRTETAGLFGTAGKEQRRGIAETTKGYDRAQRQVDLLGGSSRQQVRDQGARAVGSGTQRLMTRGLSSGANTGALQRGVASDTARNLGAVNQSVAGAQSSIAAQKGTALGGMAQQLAALYERRARAMGQLTGAQVDTITSRMDIPNTSTWASSLGNIGLGLVGMGIGQNGLFGGRQPENTGQTMNTGMGHQH